MKVRAVAYATNDAYWKEAEKLRCSLGELGIHYKICREEVGHWTWEQAVRWKPTFCLRELVLAERDGFDGILYVDADAVFRNVPNWENLIGYDAGLHFFQRSRHHEIEALTGTLWLRARLNVVDTLGRWEKATKGIPSGVSTPEQHSLKAVLRAASPPLRIANLGPEWCYIFDDFKSIYPNVRPVIEHFQASRRLRK